MDKALIMGGALVACVMAWHHLGLLGLALALIGARLLSIEAELKTIGKHIDPSWDRG